MKELDRKTVPCQGDIQTTCHRCGGSIYLHFNGGELDSMDCCGLRYELVCTRIDLVVSDLERGKP